MTHHDLAERAPYYVRIAVDSADANRVYFASVLFSTTVDGGRTLIETSYRAGGDNHDVWVDPWMPERILVGHDGGGSISENRGESWRRVVPPVAQMYHVTVDDRIPYRVYGNRQDGYSYRGPSRTPGGGIPLGLWEGVGGCESGWATPEPHDDNMVWSGCYDGGLEIYDDRSGHVRDVRVWPEAGYGWAPADLKVRWHWNFPMVLSRHEPGTTWVGSQFVHRSTNRGQSWETISPDLTTNDKSRQQDSGGITVDNLYTFDGSVLFALAESPLRAGQLWAGSVDGKVHVTTDGGETWLDRSGNVPGLDQDAWVKFIEPSHHDPETAYLAVSWHQSGDFRPHIYRTRDLGESWERISDGIPESPFSFVHVVREDPARAGILFAGTDNRVWASLDDGDSWFSLQLDMPPAPIYGMVIQERFQDLVVATYGRGFYILDGVGPLRALADTPGDPLRVFDSPAAWRFLPRQSIKSEPGSLVTGRNAPYGAPVSWWVDGDAAGERAEITIVNGDGETVRTLRGPAGAGLSRVYWDLRGETPGRATLRTRPPDRDWVEMGEDGQRRIRTWDLDIFPGYRGLLQPPGGLHRQGHGGGTLRGDHPAGGGRSGIRRHPRRHPGEVRVPERHPRPVERTGGDGGRARVGAPGDRGTPGAPRRGRTVHRAARERRRNRGDGDRHRGALLRRRPHRSPRGRLPGADAALRPARRPRERRRLGRRRLRPHRPAARGSPDSHGALRDGPRGIPPVDGRAAPALLAVAGRCASGGWLLALGPDGGRALPFRDS